GATTMFGKIGVFALTGALVASSFVASDAQAAGWIVGLVDGKSIVTIDPVTRKVMSKVDIKGASPLIGIDVRPADGMLYGVAGAYTSSWKGAKATTLYNIDAATGVLVTQAPPNDGVLNTVGSLGMPVSGPVAFNIVATGEDKNEGWLVANGALYSVDLKTGKAAMVGKIEGLGGNLGDIAWID